MAETTNEKVIALDIQPLLMPLAVFMMGLFLFGGLVIGSNNIASSIRGGVVAGTGTTNTTGTTTDTGTNTGTNTGTTTSATIDDIKDLFVDGNIRFGNADSKLLFVEVADPSCPYCHIAGGKNPELNKSAGAQFTLVSDGGAYVAPVPEMKRLVEEGKASYVWLYANGHGAGELGTQAFYCAYEKGKFWEVHDLLMSSAGYNLINNTVKNDKAKAGELAQFLASAMNQSEMQSCLESGKYADRIAQDQQTANSLGVSGTPGYFVNTTNFPGAYSYKDMESAINSALGS